MQEQSVPSSAASAGNRLPLELAERIVELARQDDLGPGDRLTETGLAAALAVSRTPVRAALRELERLGIVALSPNRGATLRLAPAAVDTTGWPKADGAEDALIVELARDRRAGALADHVTEADLMRRYPVARPVLTRVLGRLAEGGVVARKPGYGWTFLPLDDDPAGRAESYRFRAVIEPAALLEPAFRLDLAWSAQIRAAHEAMLREPWHEAASVAFYEMNAAFHEGLARCSGNRFFHLAVVHQNRLRRFRNYDWVHGHERVLVNTREHLAILDRLDDGDREVASVLLRRHIEGAERLVRQREACL
ncbi:MAG TPA: GntR family transcriptional regulator [Beijerinckiaceae bacterium]